MSDIIHLLPDSVANQIAAGEVVQRPASAVKELMENALDAGSASIKLIIKDAGKTLIQVIDSGCGMSETDARMSFERHATSKIRKADDLFAIRTMGFRGEALASIAAIAQVELKTKRIGDELGVKIEIDGSELKNQEACSCSEGTSISVKNLFYNVPARRNFLKTDSVELRHIIDEFQRVSIPNPQVAFTLQHNTTEIFNLPTGNLKQRLMAIFGSSYNSRLIPVEENTGIVKIKGFVIKPEFAKKTRGEQFFFLNKRFIKNAYLHHAVQSAFEQLLPNDSFASYFLMLDVDPKTIDINIHPTKTEVKFEDEKAIYAFLRSTVKKSLGQFNIAPSLDFNQEAHIYNMPLKPADGIYKQPTIKVDENYNPFKTESLNPSKPSERELSNKANWEKMYSRHADNQLEFAIKKEEETQQTIHTDWDNELHESNKKTTYQLHNKYILSHIKTGFMVIDQQGAHERILYESFLEAFEKHRSATQQELFPKTIELNASDFALVKELEAEIREMGFDIAEFGKNTFVIHGVPADTVEYDSAALLEGLIENYKQNLLELKSDKRENLARSMARNMAIKSGKSLTQEEMNNLIDNLFACKMPYNAPNGKPVITTFSIDELDRRFKK
ncbi:MAG: DNA mismatch repair protein MutL [Bacteroidetes bacterium RIFCSPLOWO2_12_FULL_35_15]|nr:MAG: DNA mismatch repair protein MutL [Bacteroidetes bacterium RIFCSPLOWO2_12_FULL_35_15]